MTTDFKPHPSNEVLERYSLGHLSEAEVERVEEHLFVCQHCQQELTALDSYIEDVKEACRLVNREAAPARAHWRELLSRLFSFPKPVMAGACAALAIALIAPFAMRRATPGLPATVQLETYRGAADAGAAEAPAGHTLRLKLNMAGLPASPAYRAEVVNASGSQIWTGALTPDNFVLVAEVNRPLAAGQYWVRIYDSANNLLRESALRLK